MQLRDGTRVLDEDAGEHARVFLGRALDDGPHQVLHIAGRLRASRWGSGRKRVEWPSARGRPFWLGPSAWTGAVGSASSDTSARGVARRRTTLSRQAKMFAAEPLIACECSWTACGNARREEADA